MFSAGAPTGGALGYQLGGLATQLAPSHWRAVFFVQAGISALVFILGIFFIENDRPYTLSFSRKPLKARKMTR